MEKLTGEGLAAFATDKVGMPYFYGSKISHGILTEQFMEAMHVKFPKLVDEAYLEKARKNGQVGKVNTDCSGLIGAYRGMERATPQLYSTAALRVPISRYCRFPVGTVLWKQGHVGVYIGVWKGIPRCVEAKGIDYGTILSNVEDTDWKMGLLFSDIRYRMFHPICGSYKGENPYLEPAFPVMTPEMAGQHRGEKTVTYGEGVRWLQWELLEAGYEQVVDGVFGKKTQENVIAFQTSCELCPDGIVGKKTKENLKK
ncbi:MAG: peptidoglycan-binding domain-containing protein [Eubacterium sp.]